MDYLVKRLSEPSTYAGLAAILAELGYTIPTPYVHAAILVGTVASAIAAIVMKDGWKQALQSGDAVTAVETTAASLTTTMKE